MINAEKLKRCLNGNTKKIREILNSILEQEYIDFEVENILKDHVFKQGLEDLFEQDPEELKNEILKKIENQRRLFSGRDGIKIMKDYFSPALWLNGIGYDFGETFNLSKKLQNDLRKWSRVFDDDMNIFDYEIYTSNFEEYYNDCHDEPLSKARLREIELKYKWCQKQNLNLARAVKRELGNKYVVHTLEKVIYELRLGIGLLKNEKNETILLNELCKKLEIPADLELEKDLYLWAKSIRSGDFGNIKFSYSYMVDERDERGKNLARRIEKLFAPNYIVRYEPLSYFGEEI